ncbi:Acetyl-CoA-benzylalcohol acetyltransferase [Camellia lanceoleosa]|uniref:Acetyl-CoA-benzylalcohol acetyltransferase n=2 Tax=Camellia lanceoleosa TaxID=1840588 RepID=A0ACC0IS27_9ERIC|nr:Acetyl-CoA-benzylalcohol acetyltransferase [Camellia lanceoleosa]
MTIMMKPQILSKKLIKPSTPTPRHHLKLSFMDQLIPPTYLNMIFYYSSYTKVDDNERCAQLEQSLAQTLTKFYPLAGRLVEGDLLIHCNDEGVHFIRTRVNGQLDDFLHGGPNADLLNQFLPLDIGGPLVAIQVNMFDCGGLVVGVSVSHKVADAFSIITFVNGWAAANKAGIEDVISPSFELGSLFPASDLLPPNPPSTTAKAQAKIAMKRFFFAGVAIQALIEKARPACISALRPPTQVAVVAALIWKSLIGVAQAKHGHLRDSLLVHPMNLRGNTAISMPENCFGNLSMLFSERFVADEEKMELGDLVSLLGNARRDVDPAKTNSVDDLCAMVSRSFGEPRREKHHNQSVDVHLCASWCGLPLYEADFGWGKPAWVSSTCSYEVVCLIENKCGGGIDAWVSLAEKDMVEFERNRDILAFTSL